MSVLIDPWGSNIVENYEHMFKKFGVSRFDSTLRNQVHHYLFERNLIIAHRDFKKVLDCMKHNKPFINITAIATSGKLHFGHKIILDLFMFFQSFKQSKNHFGIADIDGFISRDNIKTFKQAQDFAVNNLAQALALGIQKKNVYVQSKQHGRYYTLSYELSKKLTENMFKAVYGHLHMGKLGANMLQYADILHPQLKEWHGKMPSVTAIGLEQDPHARITRDLSRKSGYPMEIPSFIYTKHQAGLQQSMKMSSSQPNTTIFLDDPPSVAEKKILRAFSGGKESLAEHRKKGGNPDIDRAYELLLFHHPDTRLLERIYTDYKSGKMLTKELKQICIEHINSFLKKHQAKLKQTTKTAEKIIFG